MFLFSTSLKLQRFGRRALIFPVLSFFNYSPVRDRAVFCDRLNSFKGFNLLL
ncbi:hypothetical protein BM1374166_00715 [Bartonella tribocorum]|nr:hypothetical protein BM1374166_00715 [Bartonella tribocorum]